MLFTSSHSPNLRIKQKEMFEKYKWPSHEPLTLCSLTKIMLTNSSNVSVWKLTIYPWPESEYDKKFNNDYPLSRG